MYFRDIFKVKFAFRILISENDSRELKDVKWYVRWHSFTPKYFPLPSKNFSVAIQGNRAPSEECRIMWKKTRKDLIVGFYIFKKLSIARLDPKLSLVFVF